MNDLKLLQNIDNKLSALIAVLVHQSNSKDSGNERRIEAVLSESGLTAPEISSVTGKNLPAVRKALQRGRNRK